MYADYNLVGVGVLDVFNVVGAIGWFHNLLVLLPCYFLDFVVRCLCNISLLVCLLGLVCYCCVFTTIFIHLKLEELLLRVTATRLLICVCLSCINFVFSVASCMNELHVMLEFDVC